MKCMLIFNITLCQILCALVLLWTYQALGCESAASPHVHMCEGLLAEGYHHCFEVFVCEVGAVLQAEGAQRCEPSQHAQALICEAAFVKL